MSYDNIEHSDNPVPDHSDGRMDDDERAEIEAERKRRLDADNRPDGAEVDNTSATLPTLEAWEAEQEAEDGSANVGTSDPSKVFREIEMSQEELDAIAAERERRLDPANRPEGAEVDNTGRTVVDGRFTDGGAEGD